MRILLGIGLGAALLVGCASNQRVENPLGSSEGEAAQLAAYAAATTYPSAVPAANQCGGSLSTGRRNWSAW